MIPAPGTVGCVPWTTVTGFENVHNASAHSEPLSVLSLCEWLYVADPPENGVYGCAANTKEAVA
jgi:hypothetical protein